jgi:hypothetical protein
MEKTKITLEDIAFHIKRLTDALETFGTQIRNTNVIYENVQPKKVQPPDSKAEEMVWEILRSTASHCRKHGLHEHANKLLNPSPSELQQLIVDEIKSQKEENKREADQRRSERLQLKAIDNKHNMNFNKLKIGDIKSDYIIVCGNSEFSDLCCGRIGELPAPVLFPLSLRKIKKDLTMGVLPMEISSLDNIKALIDPSLVSKSLKRGQRSLFVKTC